MAKTLRECLVPLDAAWHRGDLSKEAFDKIIAGVGEDTWANYLLYHGRGNLPEAEMRRKEVQRAAEAGFDTIHAERRKATRGVREGSPENPQQESPEEK